jgi:hypothetical protein
VAFIDSEQVRAELSEGLVCVGIVECAFDQSAVACIVFIDRLVNATTDGLVAAVGP